MDNPTMPPPTIRTSQSKRSAGRPGGGLPEDVGTGEALPVVVLAVLVVLVVLAVLDVLDVLPVLRAGRGGGAACARRASAPDRFAERPAEPLRVSAGTVASVGTSSIMTSPPTAGCGAGHAGGEGRAGGWCRSRTSHGRCASRGP
ncbi:hypothetical protein GCM10012287_51440 [Streptomyces daqingensis]|uniref:Uncharacterized protein n=1 Tax=Streptomyces daqingensis TaxID=1472640 RepID=A0ABQ2MSP6_9ACTN|nr:hypothetical protein GCM10012287_51440 [Streptomyces daqingensis]